MQKFLFFLIAPAVLFQSVALATDDGCEDYFQRHNKADLVPVSASLTNVPHSGDISGYQSLDVVVLNTGNLPLSGPTTGLIQAKQAMIAVTPLAGGTTETFQAWVGTPLKPGAKWTLSAVLPTGRFANCTKVSIRIDARRTAGQHGCQCYANDVAQFQLHIAGAPRCFHHIPHKP